MQKVYVGCCRNSDTHGMLVSIVKNLTPSPLVIPNRFVWLRKMDMFSPGCCSILCCLTLCIQEKGSSVSHHKLKWWLPPVWELWVITLILLWVRKIRFWCQVGWLSGLREINRNTPNYWVAFNILLSSINFLEESYKLLY